MLFVETAVDGVMLIEPEPVVDVRGSFARTYGADEFAAHGLSLGIVQTSIARNHLRGTLRGLHFQRAPHAEAKLMQCIRGSAFVVAVDLREGSPTFGQHVSTELDARTHRALYLSEGCAAGYQTLEDDAEILYQIGTRHAPGFEGGVHHADPRLAIAWPLPVTVISDRDANLPMLEIADPGR